MEHNVNFNEDVPRHRERDTTNVSIIARTQYVFIQYLHNLVLLTCLFLHRDII